MNLHDLARDDLAKIYAGNDLIVVTSPEGRVETFVGIMNDIAQTIDPDTGHIISGRVISSSLRIDDFLRIGLKLPAGVVDQRQRPWLVSFKNETYKVRQADQDRTLGLITLLLEVYR